MKRMIPDPGKVIKCSHENDGRVSRVYIPINNLDELPITFDLIITSSTNMIAHLFVFYSNINGELRGEGSFVIPFDTIGTGNINVAVDIESIVYPEKPFIGLELSYERGDIQSAPLTDNNLVFVTNVIHLEKGVIDI